MQGADLIYRGVDVAICLRTSTVQNGALGNKTGDSLTWVVREPKGSAWEKSVADPLERKGAVKSE